MQEHTATLADQQRLGRWSRFTINVPSLTHLQPGQYVALRCAAGGSYDPLIRLPLWVANSDAHAGTLTLLIEQGEAAFAFLTEVPTGKKIELLGPIGHGWQITPTARTMAILGTATHAAALFGLAQHAVRRGLAVTLLLGTHEPDAAPPPFLLPSDAEYNVAHGSDITTAALDLLTDETLRWADQLAVALPLETLPTIAQRLRQTRLNWTDNMAQALLLPPPACHVGVCGTCTIPTRQGYRLGCTDGPVFDLKRIIGSR